MTLEASWDEWFPSSGGEAWMVIHEVGGLMGWMVVIPVIRSGQDITCVLMSVPWLEKLSGDGEVGLWASWICGCVG